MPPININNLPKFAPKNVGDNVGGSSSARPTSGANNTAAGGGFNGGIDWFSQLDAGKAHTMTPQDQFGKNPSLDDIVKEIVKHLGIEA